MTFREIVRYVFRQPWRRPEECPHPSYRIVDAEDGPVAWRCLDCGERGWRQSGYWDVE